MMLHQSIATDYVTRRFPSPQSIQKKWSGNARLGSTNKICQMTIIYFTQIFLEALIMYAQMASGSLISLSTPVLNSKD